MSVSDETFNCAGCGKSYKWKPELAGKRARCKCGHDMHVPASLAAPRRAKPAAISAAAPVVADEDDAYDLAPVVEAPKPARPKPVPAAATAAAAGRGGGPAAAVAMPGTQPGQVLGYAGGRGAAKPGREELENSIGGNLATELYIPAVLVILGIFMQAWLAMEEAGVGFVESLPVIGLRLFGGLILSFGAVAIVARLFEISFGAPGPAVLKMAACVLLPPAVGAVIGHIVGSDSSFVQVMVASILFFPLTWVMLWWLFTLDFEEALWLEVSIWLVQQWVMMFLIGLLLQGFDIGAGGGGGRAPPGRAVVDQKAQVLLNMVRTTDAKEWITAGTGRQLGTIQNAQARAVIQKLKDIGAKDVKLFAKPGESSASVLIIGLPGGSKPRKELHDYALAVTDEHGGVTDLGSSQMLMRFNYAMQGLERTSNEPAEEEPADEGDKDEDQ